MWSFCLIKIANIQQFMHFEAFINLGAIRYGESTLNQIRDLENANRHILERIGVQKTYKMSIGERYSS